MRFMCVWAATDAQNGSNYLYIYTAQYNWSIDWSINNKKKKKLGNDFNKDIFRAFILYTHK